MEFAYKKKSGLTLHKALTLEWLETNGLGGYSSSTILNCHTRKYHGLLVSKLNCLADKYVLLSKVDDVLLSPDGQRYNLTSHQYPNFLQDVFPDFQEFSLNPNPRFVYQFDKITLVKEILLFNDEDTVALKYTISGDGIDSRRYKLEMRPLFACRNFHALSKENTAIKKEIKDVANGFAFTAYDGLPGLFLQMTEKTEFNYEPLWYRNFLYEIEKSRGFDFAEDLFSASQCILPFQNNNTIIFSCSTKEQDVYSLEQKWNAEINRRNFFYEKFTGSPMQKHLQKVGMSFVDKNPCSHTMSVVAGYHWFLDWGRDAMISLPGLTLYSGFEAKCLAILKEFASNERDGVIPNYLGEIPENNAYNSVDAGLWFAWAVQQYSSKTKDVNSIDKYLWIALKNIFINYKNGTLYNIKMDVDSCLLYAGSKEVNLTWMDAMVAGCPVTPRYGYAVEVNALWYNMLCFMRVLAVLFNDPIRYELDPIIDVIKLKFEEFFWNNDRNCLYDYINEEQKNAAIRPNQIFAVSLTYSPLSGQNAAKVVNVVKEHLLTPYGLRTLSSTDPNYIGDYSGDSASRDKAYHNGTVWPWLLGHFGEALLKVSSDRKHAIDILEPCILSLKDHLFAEGIGTIAEIFSGDAPHKSNGCISQAWSVAEILRLTYLLNAEIER